MSTQSAFPIDQGDEKNIVFGLRNSTKIACSKVLQNDDKNTSLHFGLPDNGIREERHLQFILSRLCNEPINNTVSNIESFLCSIGITSSDNRRDLVMLIQRALADEARSNIKQGERPLYKDRNSSTSKKLNGRNIVEWLRVVWGPEMENGILTRQMLRELDPQADKAVENWLLKMPLPPDIKIPTKKDLNDAALSRISSTHLRQAASLASAAHHRKTTLKVER